MQTMTSGASLHCLFLIEMVAWFLNWTILGLVAAGSNSNRFCCQRGPILMGPADSRVQL